MITEPVATALTTPALTVATDVLDDCHVAWLVTLCELESDNRAVAEHCTVVVPVPHATANDESVGDGAVGALLAGVEVPLPQALRTNAMMHAPTSGGANR